MTVEVTEHQLIARRCASGPPPCGAAPQGVSAPVQYRPPITGIVLYLYVGQFLWKKRAAQALGRAVRHPAVGGHCRRDVRARRRRAGRVPRCRRERIVEAASTGFDETRLRVAGKLHWVHCARTRRYPLITCTPTG